MSKSFKEDEGQTEPIITLTPDSMVHPNRPNQSLHGHASQGGHSGEKTPEMHGEKPLDPSGAEAGRPMADPVSDEAKDKEIAELKDKYLRALAEHENARRRIRQQSEDSIKRQKENLLHDLLPIVDNLERAVEAAKGQADGKSIIAGVQLVLASLMDFLKTNGVRPMASVGEQFDPNRHEAGDHVPHSSHPANTVVSEFHRGYLINDKVLRPARVVVSKGDGDDRGPKAE